MKTRFFEVQVTRFVEIDGYGATIESTITSPVAAPTERAAWLKFCDQRGWTANVAPSPQMWVRTITPVGKVRWKYLCECYFEGAPNE